MKNLISISGALFLLNYSCSAQKFDYIWFNGYDECGHPPIQNVGNMFIDFNQKPTTCYNVPNLCFKMGPGNVSMANIEGAFLFASNSRDIVNFNNVILNNQPLALGPYNFDSGMQIPNGVICLPSPINDSVFYYLYPHIPQVVANPNGGPLDLFADTLELAIVDMRANGGQGALTVINQPVLIDSLAAGQAASVKHANGRDWWIIFPEYLTNCYWTFLLTQQGLGTPFKQCLGDVMNNSYHYGQAAFSPNGEIYANYNVWHDLELLDFDRCTGSVSNPQRYYIADSMGAGGSSIGGMSFSPDGRFIYASSHKYIYQLDLHAPDVQASLTPLDTIRNNWPDQNMNWVMHQPGPDGRNYVASTYILNHHHIIERPNQSGRSCQVRHQGFYIPSYGTGGFPNHPNYRLGPIDGSACDTLGLDQALAAHVESLNYGHVLFAQDSTRSFWVHNEGEGALNVTEFYFDSIGFSSNTPLPFTVQPHDSALVEVIFTPTAVQRFDAQMTLFHNGIFGLSTVLLAGEGDNAVASTSVETNPANVRIRPNPTNGEAWMDVAVVSDCAANWQLYDALGRLVAQEQVGLYTGYNSILLPVAGLPSGVYSLTLSGTCFGRITKRLVCLTRT